MVKNLATALLLEDEPLISMDIEYILGEAGFNVVPVMSCTEALGWLNDNRPDVVIVDIILKDGPCDEVVTRLVDEKIPFVVHSGDRPSQHAGTPFAAGGWVNKPSDGASMLTAIHQALAA